MASGEEPVAPYPVDPGIRDARLGACMNALIRFAALMAVFISLPALAQDNLADWDWSQFYVGAGGSYSSTTPSVGGPVALTVNGVTRTSLDSVQDMSAFILAGFTHEYAGSVVAGLEGDIDLGGPISIGTLSDGPCFLGTVTCATGGVVGTVDPLGHLRALLGYAPDARLLLFTSVGLAAANATAIGARVEARAVSGGSSGGSASTATYQTPITGLLPGVTVGAGAQVKVTGNVSIRAEVLHDMYGALAVPSTGLLFGGAGSGSQSASASVDIRGIWAFSRTTARISLIAGF